MKIKPIKLKKPEYFPTIYNTYYVYNQSMDYKKIDLFNKNKKHTGVIHTSEINQKTYDKEGQLFHINRSGYLKNVRMQSYRNFPMFRPIEIIENGKLTKVMALYYFSAYQNQSTIFEINVNRKVKDFNILYPLEHDENSYISMCWVKNKDIVNIKDESFITVMTSAFGSKRKKKIKINRFPSDVPHTFHPQKQLSLVVNNTNNETVRVDLLALLSGKKYDGVEFESPISDISKNNIYNHLKIASSNTKQVIQNIVLEKNSLGADANSTINIISSINAYQNHLWIVDVNRPFEFKDSDSLFVDILGNTKCIYYFYEHEPLKIKK